MPRAPLPPEAYIAVNANLPCLNPNCKSHGAPHVGCKCYSHSGGPALGEGGGPPRAHGDVGPQHFSENFAQGGSVCAQDLPHHPDCPFFAEGGDVQENHEFNTNHELALDHAVANHGLHHLLTKTGHTRSEEPHRAAQDFIEHAKRGKYKLHAHVNSSFDKKMPNPETHGVEELKNHVEDLSLHPEKILDMGGNMGQSLPIHSGLMAAKASTAVSYLHSLKPLGNQMSPFDKIQPPSKMEEHAYDRQLQLAQHPLTILNHIKSGTVNPRDLETIQTLYPKLGQSIKEKTFEKVAAAKENGTVLPYKQKLGLSTILGPLDSTQTPAAMQAIIKSAGGNTKSETQQPANQGKSQKGATAQTQKTIDKTTKLYADPLDQIQMSHK